MNVAEAAAKYQVSKQAIYQHLNKLSSKGRDARTGTLNADGLNLLERIYNQPDNESIKIAQAELTLAKETITKQSEEIARQKAAIAALEGAKRKAEEEHTEECEALQSKLQTAETRVEGYRGQVAAMQEEINKLNELLTAQKQGSEVLSVKLASAEEKVKGLEGERDFLRDQLSKAITPALPAATAKPEKVTLRQALALWLGGKSSTAPKDKPE